ncbi:MAG: phage coat protein [Clostridia bacterium]|nr:phage coat protein [Clostridia bacterium]
MAKFDAKSFNPQAFGKYVERIPKTKKNELIKSGVLKGNKEIRDAFSSQTGTAYAVLPMYGRIGGKVQNYDGETDMDPQGSTTYERGVVVVGRMGSWVEKDFSTDITGGVDFMDNVAAQVSEYFEDVDQDTLLAILKGIFAMTGAKNLEFVNNHTFDITEEEGEKSKAGATTLNSAIQKASGDKKAKFTMAIMHSTVATNLENLQLLAYLKYTDANGVQRDLTLASWNGRIVLIDDNMPTEEVEASEGVEAHIKYTTYLLGDGAIDYENIGAKVPFEMDRDPKTNGGQDTLYARQRKVFAPYGISYTKKSQAKLSPTDEELANGANWELVHDAGTGASRKYIDDKQIYIARIISKG